MCGFAQVGPTPEEAAILAQAVQIKQKQEAGMENKKPNALARLWGKGKKSMMSFLKQSYEVRARKSAPLGSRVGGERERTNE